MQAVARSSPFGLSGVVAGFVALAFSILPFFVLPAMFPPKPLDQTIAETAIRVKERIAAHTKGEEPPSPTQPAPSEAWYRVSTVLAIALGLGAMAAATASFLRREDRRYAAVATTLGVGAIAVQVALLALGVLAIFLIVLWVLSQLGVSL
jgi:hypothetical protein